MTPTIFDIETTAIDNFRTLQGLERIHCLVIRQGDRVDTYHGDSLEEGLRCLRIADIIVGHNVLGFDIPAIQKLYPDWKPEGLVRDTLLLARLKYPDQKNLDFSRPGVELPRNLIGSHSLAAWGHRLGVHKGDYGSKENAWDQFTDEMLDYCIQDTLVTQRLFQAITAQQDDTASIALEHEFAEVIDQQEKNGFAFDLPRAAELYGEWSQTRDDLRKQLIDRFPPAQQIMKTPAWWLAGGDQYPTKGAAKKAGYKDSEITKGPNRVKEIPFNPDSRQQIARCLQDKYDREPAAFTANGQPQIDESILKALPFEEAKMLVDYLTIAKRIGQLAEGNEAWMKLCENGRIYGSVITNGTVTGRCTHSRPNLAQCPSITAPYGKECRSLFIAPEGRSLVGVDASGLELRCLAHYLWRWDDGKYADIILNGDIHTANQKAAGLENRSQAKTFIYGWLYGAGPGKIGSIVGGTAKDGQQLMARFLKRMPALKHLKDSINSTLEKRDYLVGLDGRHIPVRSQHSALNALLQSAGAVIMKQATVDADRRLKKAIIDVKQVAHIHDEIQYEVAEEDAVIVGEAAVAAICMAGQPFGFRCPLDGEYRIGKNWAETH